MTSREPFQHAIANPAARRDIALAVQSGIPAEQLAEEFGISGSTVRAYAREFENVQRTIRRLDPWERESIVNACRRGARRRWERELGPEVVRELLGES
ncbi:helix-turn-helix domain-containing protein [Mycobacterium aquaticum]|uniref:Helix-turn-helix domain-containing protein n=1 Tax=Mycobacterium aquaticum TaxID=1927124 RepID=A0A1X0ABG5_9MYCO|nr:helix-turn-helix domain-containing protein [Mycobacterium aquaticum]ORA27397.1 helix-turn-helix domain-containing protein [Mycobacterium aquaticum]